MLTPLDYGVIVVYLVGVATLGIRMGGRQESAADYFLGGGRLPWWAVSLSVVATETSTLTVIGIPAVAYGGSMTFFQLTFGYLLGRIAVAWLLLPRYFAGDLQTAYGFLGARYGDRVRSLASVTFLATRLLADGVRLFATAIPIRVIFASAGFDIGYPEIILTIALVTVAYTYTGGLRAVVWMDVVQLVLYVGGAVGAVWLLASGGIGDWVDAAAAEGKLRVVDVDFGLTAILTGPYNLVTAAVGGAIFSMASHGTDHLIVQRLMACRTLEDSRRALVGSAVVVMFQFALFLAVGLLLWGHYRGATLADLGLTRGDEVFPRFIIEGMPPGVSGLLLAGIVAAAMSTLSSSLSALAASTVYDLWGRRRERVDARTQLRVSRLATLGWGLVFVVFANLFRDQQNPVVELGLSIASFTYGGLLGVFALGLLHPRTRARDAAVALVVSVAAMILVIFGVWHGDAVGWIFDFRPSPERIAAEGLRPLAWPWYTTVGTLITLGIGSLTAMRHR